MKFLLTKKSGGDLKKGGGGDKNNDDNNDDKMFIKTIKNNVSKNEDGIQILAKSIKDLKVGSNYQIWIVSPINGDSLAQSETFSIVSFNNKPDKNNSSKKSQPPNNSTNLSTNSTKPNELQLQPQLNQKNDSTEFPFHPQIIPTIKLMSSSEKSFKQVSLCCIIFLQILKLAFI
ncbi:hypothetical protein BY996DRAFT_1287303 [Phakopsora pachyrhizi]|nr:hypothetical protein BY996DRAFT_1287303 [Phakopsora pachyrhizi]